VAKSSFVPDRSNSFMPYMVHITDTRLVYILPQSLHFTPFSMAKDFEHFQESIIYAAVNLFR
jgi:hypothetical protein